MPNLPLDPLKPNGNYMYQLLWPSATLHFVFMGFVRFSVQTVIISLNSINQLIVVMVKCCVLFEVRTEFLNNI
jgi:D-alanyl-lipoteichoic acid acyltransferase DltB (MBOAT superfamily)